MQGDVLEVSHVHVEPEYRGRGEAAALMANVCLAADLAGKFLMVHVEPDNDSPLDRETLAKWYGRLGFKTIQVEPLLMVRPHVRAGIALANPSNVVRQ